MFYVWIFSGVKFSSMFYVWLLVHVVCLCMNLTGMFYVWRLVVCFKYDIMKSTLLTIKARQFVDHGKPWWFPYCEWYMINQRFYAV